MRTLTTNIRESFEEIICENLAAAESVEQQLWRLHYKFIEEFRGRLGRLRTAATAAANLPRKKKGSEEEKFLRVGGQYKCFLDEATGFYHGLIAKLRAKHGLPTDLSSPFSSAGMTNCSQSLSKYGQNGLLLHETLGLDQTVNEMYASVPMPILHLFSSVLHKIFNTVAKILKNLAKLWFYHLYFRSFFIRAWDPRAGHVMCCNVCI